MSERTMFFNHYKPRLASHTQPVTIMSKEELHQRPAKVGRMFWALGSARPQGIRFLVDLIGWLIVA